MKLFQVCVWGFSLGFLFSTTFLYYALNGSGSSVPKRAEEHFVARNHAVTEATEELTKAPVPQAAHVASSLAAESLEILNRPNHELRLAYLIGGDPDKSVSSLPARKIHKSQRDLNTHPIAIAGWKFGGALPCDVPCETCSGEQCDVTRMEFSMENVDVGLGPVASTVLKGNTRLASQVPVPYFSWHDFGIMTPAKEKTASSLAAAFISNCGFAKRNSYTTQLQDLGVSVDSFGKCNRNAEEPKLVSSRGGNKIAVLGTYKFSLAFENSETPDYVTEKLFGSFVAGSVPVVIGAPNAKFFAPDSFDFPAQSRALIHTDDFESLEDLAEYLKFLDSNDTAYGEYLRWKTEGYSEDFQALFDLTDTHSACRRCNLAGDRIRLQQGPTAYDEKIPAFGEGDHTLFVRERGAYKFIELRLGERTLSSLVDLILRHITPRVPNLWLNNEHPHPHPRTRLYGIYELHTKTVINSDDAVRHLPDRVELEVVLLTPGKPSI